MGFYKIYISTQRFSTRGDSVPRSHLEMSAHTFGDCHNWWRSRERLRGGAVIGLYWLKPKMLLNILQCTGQSPITINQVSNASSTKVEKPYYNHKVKI